MFDCCTKLSTPKRSMIIFLAGTFFAPWFQPYNERMNAVDAFWHGSSECDTRANTRFGPLNWNFMWLLSNSFSQMFLTTSVRRSRYSLSLQMSTFDMKQWHVFSEALNFMLHSILCIEVCVRARACVCVHKQINTEEAPQWHDLSFWWEVKQKERKKKIKTTEPYRYKTNNQLTSKTEKLK